MRSLAEEGVTMLIVTDEPGLAYSVADQVIYLHGGRIVEQGTPEEVLLRLGTARMRAFLSGFSQIFLLHRQSAGQSEI